jgi:Pyruvate/2-oxoacid:ferredoxin oxidoreductase delta subunit
MTTPATLSRRDLLFGRLRAGLRRAAPEAADAASVAVIQGRHCLAYRGLMCSTCYERCPEPGAIVTERGIPRVVNDCCTGCGVCHDVCPAPVNAVLMIGGAPSTRERGERHGTDT